MKTRLMPSILVRTYSEPMAWLNLAVDLLPIWAIFQFGWGATPLVALYWLENLVIGAVALARMVGAAIVQMGRGTLGAAGVFFLAPFFLVHYGGFCWGHGVFIAGMANQGIGMPSPAGLIDWALGSGAHMVWFLAAIIAINLFIYLVDFIGRGEIRRISIEGEMMPPYGRIVTLHLAIILGAAFAFNTEEPLMGVLLLILIRVVFGIIVSIRRRLKRDRQQAEGKITPTPA